MNATRIPEHCSTCAHWARGEGCPPDPDGKLVPQHEEEYGLCTLNPPQISTIICEDESNRWNGTPEFFQPHTTESEWCSQWEDDEEGE